jgi:hypothetical protein
MTAEWPQWLLATINDGHEGHEGAIKKGEKVLFRRGLDLPLLMVPSWPPRSDENFLKRFIEKYCVSFQEPAVISAAFERPSTCLSGKPPAAMTL